MYHTTTTEKAVRWAPPTPILAPASGETGGHAVTALLAWLFAMAVAVVPLAVTAADDAPDAASPQAADLAIPAQPLIPALNAFAERSGLQLLYSAEIAEGKTTRGVSGHLTPEEGLRELLEGTGVAYRFVDAETVTLEPAPTDAVLAQAPEPPAAPRDESADEPIMLPPITVTASPLDETSLTNPAVEEAREELRRVPGGASVIEADDYRRGVVLGGQDALRNAPGVYAQSRDGYGDIRVSIRGSGISAPFGNRGVRLLRDGLPLVRADSYFDPNFADYDAAEYVEIYRGANALEYGASTLGGAINFVLPTGYSRPGLQARLTGGSDAYFGGRFSVGKIFDEDWDGYAALSGFRTDGFRDNDEQSRLKFSGNLGRRFGTRSEGRFYFEIEEIREDNPGSLTKAALEDDPTQANARSARAEDALDFTPRSYVGYKHSFLLGDDKLDVGAFWTNTDFENPGNFAQFFYNNTDYGASLRHELNGELFGARNRFVWGASVADGKSEDDTFGPVFFGDFEAEPNPGQFEDSRDDRTTVEVFAQEQYYVAPDFSLLAGGQYVYAKRETRTEVPTPPTFFPIFFPQDEEQTYNGFSPKLGAIFSPTDAVQVFANVSRSFEPPVSFEFSSSSGDSLDAQIAWTAEIGTRGGTQQFGWDLAFYHAWVEDELLSIETPPNSGQFETSNVDETTHLGVEAGVSTLLPLGFTALDDALHVNLAYTWSHFRFDDDPTFGNNELPAIPEHVFNLEALYRHPSGFFAGPNLQVASSWFADQANSLKADSFAIVGLRAGYENERRGIRVFVDVRNLADEAYAASTQFLADASGMDAPVFNPGIDRTVFVGIDFDTGFLQ